MLNVVETFSGIGAQTEALKRANIEHHVSATVEWDINAIYAYDIMHNGPQDLSIYRHHNKESLITELSQYNLSSDGKTPLTEQSLMGMSMGVLKSILYAIERAHNLVDINQVNASDLDEDIDLLTYSFPCQDLSVSSLWWHNDSGIDRDSGNRSSLIWQIERILLEFSESNRTLPKALLMENVSNILSKKHIDNFNEWKNFLEELGYYNKVYTLNSKDFGIPQSRERTYLLSIYVGDDQQKRDLLEEYFFNNNLENISLKDEQISSLEAYLKLDYTDDVFRDEAIEATPNFTPSREKIYKNNPILAIDSSALNNQIARTITTKQDRHPNSGIITFSDNKQLIPGCKYRNITPREAFLLMGFQEETYNKLLKSNEKLNDSKPYLTSTKLLKLAGNSIVVDVLIKIFEQLEEIRVKIL